MPGSQTTPTETKETRIKSQDYDGWSKFDVEKEATKVDKKPQLPTAPTDKPDIPSQLSEKGECGGGASVLCEWVWPCRERSARC